MTLLPAELLRTYQQLNNQDKLVLRIFSYCAFPLSIYDLGQILVNRMMTRNISASYKSLQDKELLQVRQNKCIIRKNIALTVLADALADKEFSGYIPGIDRFEYDYRWTDSPYRYLRELLSGYYLKTGKVDPGTVNVAQGRVSYYFDYLEPVAGNPGFGWLFSTLGEKALYTMLDVELLDIHADLRSMENVILFDKALKNIGGLVANGISGNMILANYYLLNGDFVQMDACIDRIPEKYRNSLLPVGIHELYNQKAAVAYPIMHNVMKSKKKSEMFVNYEIFYAVYYILSLLGLETEQYIPEAQNMLSKGSSSFNYPAIIASAMLNFALGKEHQAAETLSRADLFSSSVSNLENIFLYVAACYTDSKIGSKYLQPGRALFEKAKTNGYKLLALELAYSLAQIYEDEKDFAKSYIDLSEELDLTAVLSRRVRHERWEIALNNLLGTVSNISPVKSKNGKTTRIVYYISPENQIVQPTLQTATAGGGWTKGRNIAMKRLKAMDIEGMTDQDRRIAETIKASHSYYGWDNENNLYFSDDVWPALAGHSCLFLASNPDVPVELIKAQPTITVEEKNESFILKADVDPGDERFIIQKETNTRYKLIEIDSRQRAILQTINQGSLVIPREGKDKLIQTLEGVSNFLTIQSDMAETRQGVRTVEGDSRIRVQLLPLGNSLKAELFVKPFGSVPPYYKPGVGGQNIIGMVDDERCHVSRDLKTEARYADAILQEIQQNTNIDTTREPIVFEDPRDSLYLLEVLARHQDIAVVEWPEGVRFKINRSVSMSQVKLEVRGVDYWFEVDGDLQVDENTVLTLKQLLELNNKSHGRFIELGNGEFLALSNDLKKRLDEIQAYVDISGNQVKMSRYASIPLMEMFGQVGSFKSDSKWMDFQKKLTEAKDVQPGIPKTLQAELRPYQEEGFQWMVRLSEWGAGACLADDMGLGKTVQALAMLLHRAEKGAALVVCPASVVHNWVNETNRFAPTLNIVLLTSANRKETLQQAGAFDVVVTTYGLLQSEEKLFAKEKWATVVLDEAHAIKNNNTKTSKAVMNLDADFRLAMTGTPVQNHLGEVWNLFHFINPGLLGTMHQFNDRFVKTGEKGSKRLKKLVSPFILRRTKNNVLDELPPKTEIVNQIELSDNERVFYEAIRRKAIENLQQASGPAGQQHVRALAEITRLRLACCNTELVEPDVKMPSSKMTAFMEIVDELRGNNHRALVFSQFVKHLTLIRKELDSKKIRYKYLDGSTSQAERERNVRDFQSGEGELFLISLKAGGLGLNLTAADYVIHLDPWWNPAIEDQASDRAHRIGQKRPITIYRLVAQNTIEEKIIQLHRTKRDIADTLLEGADIPAKLSTEELLKLIVED